MSLDGPICNRQHRTEKVCDGVDSICVAQNRNQLWGLLNTGKSGMLSLETKNVWLPATRVIAATTLFINLTTFTLYK
jgi:hypothetical protein